MLCVLFSHPLIAFLKNPDAKHTKTINFKRPKQIWGVELYLFIITTLTIGCPIQNDEQVTAMFQISWACQRGVNCSEGQWKCRNISQCIEKSAMCNMVLDCQDGSDELHCDKRTCPEGYWNSGGIPIPHWSSKYWIVKDIPYCNQPNIPTLTDYMSFLISWETCPQTSGRKWDPHLIYQGNLACSHHKQYEQQPY